MNTFKMMLIRHGQTEWNKAERLHGRSDLPLNTTGMSQAQDLAQRLESQGPWDVIYTSPLFRARQTAQVISNQLRIPYLFENPELMEQDFGQAEGMLVQGLGDAERERLMNLGESQEHLLGRALTALAGIAEQHPNQNVLVVSHGALIDVVMSELSGVKHPPVANAQCVELNPTLLAHKVA